MGGYVDPLGFTRQTETILRGLGVSSLIPVCKKRNINTDTLHELDERDWITLGASEEKAGEIKKALEGMKRRPAFVKATPEERNDDFLEILRNGRDHLSFLKDYVAYCRLRLLKEQINFFVEPDKALSATDILPICVNATLTELSETEKDLRELDKFISNTSIKNAQYQKRNYFYQGLTIVGVIGLGVAILIVFKLRIK